MDKIYRQVLENDIVRISKDGTIYKYYKRQNKYKIAPIHKTGRGNRYEIISVYFNGRQYHLYVHRLLAFAFIPNPNNKPEINHKDGNSLNNDIDNLEWVTSRENTMHAINLGLIDYNKYAKECQFCYELTRSNSGICTDCQSNFKVAENQQRKLKKIRNELEDIDIRALSDRHLEIVYQRYIGKTYVEIGQEYGFSKQRACQIIEDAKSRTYDEWHYPALQKKISYK